MPNLKGYRTIIFNVVMTGIVILRLFNPDAELPEAEAVDQAVNALDAAVTAVWGLGNLILRAITDTPVLESEPKA